MKTKERIATIDEQKVQLLHSSTKRTAARIGRRGLLYWRARCGVCGETAYGSTAGKARVALDGSNCLPVEKDWNDRLCGFGREEIAF